MNGNKWELYRIVGHQIYEEQAITKPYFFLVKNEDELKEKLTEIGFYVRIIERVEPDLINEDFRRFRHKPGLDYSKMDFRSKGMLFMKDRP